MKRVSRIALAGIVGAVFAAVSGAGFADSTGQWMHYGGNDQSNTRFSDLKQINTNNVRNLKVQWMHSLGTLETQES
ncbi:MAG: hypothetical protein PVH05_05345, partial [Burkholderiales bacterium]